jgi:hypothetical protein
MRDDLAYQRIRVDIRHRNLERRVPTICYRMTHCGSPAIPVVSRLCHKDDVGQMVRPVDVPRNELRLRFIVYAKAEDPRNVDLGCRCICRERQHRHTDPIPYLHCKMRINTAG